MNATDETETLSASETTLLIMYCVVLVVGVLANASLMLAVCNQTSSRIRNPLLLGLCLSDLSVCCLSAPITLCFALFTLKPWPVAAPWCKLAFFFQTLPVAVSTLSLMVVSMDRYVTVKYPSAVSKFRHRKRVVAIATGCVWLAGFLLTCPLLVVRRVSARSGNRCTEVWGSPEWRDCFVYGHLVLVYIVPCITVMACHLGVRAKLTALSLTARAAHGELPLPMPLLRRPTHVIIVAGLPNNTDGKVMTYRPNSEEQDSEDSSDNSKLVDPAGNCSISRPKRTPERKTSAKKKRNRRPRQANKSESEIRDNNRKRRPNPAAQPVTSTLRSRKRLANTLVSAAAVFVGCWLPHVVCTICAEICALPGSQLKHFLQFSLLLGHAHSAINPVVYWALNHQSLHHSCVQGSIFGHFRLPAAYKNASSTNEAALGPFHPRYIRPPYPRTRGAAAAGGGARRQSSCYLY